jgi:hypothetical protein
MDRIGTLIISAAVVENEIKMLGQMLARIEFVPLHIDFEAWNKSYRMTGYSKDFKKIPLGNQPINYYIEAEVDDEKNLKNVKVV